MFLFTSILRPDGQSGLSGVLQRAAQATGTDFSYLLNTARRESALDPEARASTSSAAGLFQFIESTWLRAVHDWGGRYGLSDEAAAISRDSSGRMRVSDGAAREEILNLRFDPEVSALMAGEFTRANGKAVEAGIGRRASPGELYIAHFLGAAGAVDLINGASGEPNGIAADRFPAAARANRSIFYDAAGTPRGFADVYRGLVAKHQRQEEVAPLPAGQPMALTAFAGGRQGDAMFDSLFTDRRGSVAAYAPPSVSRGAGPIGQAVQTMWLNFFGKPDTALASPAIAGAAAAVPAEASRSAPGPSGRPMEILPRMPNGRPADPARLVRNGE